MGSFTHAGKLLAGYTCARCKQTGIAGEAGKGTRCRCGYIWEVKRDKGGSVVWDIKKEEPR